MKVLVECLFVAGTYDQLNLSSLASMELVARRASSCRCLLQWARALACLEGDDLAQVA